MASDPIETAQMAKSTPEDFGDDDVRAVLEDLIEVNRDGEKGFARAAEAVDDSGAAATLREFGAERGRFAGELENIGFRYGVAGGEGGSVTGALHRAWIGLKDAVAGDDHAILKAAEVGEDKAVETYEAALEADLPGDVDAVVRRQYSAVNQAHDRVRSLRDAAA
jgi:uncharacterized protein (TIGR02284 family)